jgi:hypothetical protein
MHVSQIIESLWSVLNIILLRWELPFGVLYFVESFIALRTNWKEIWLAGHMFTAHLWLVEKSVWNCSLSLSGRSKETETSGTIEIALTLTMGWSHCANYSLIAAASAIIVFFSDLTQESIVQIILREAAAVVLALFRSGASSSPHCTRSFQIWFSL